MPILKCVGLGLGSAPARNSTYDVAVRCTFFTIICNGIWIEVDFVQNRRCMI